VDPADELLPRRHVRLAALQPQPLQDDRVEALAGQDERHLVDGVHVLGGDDRLLRHVAVERELGLDVGGEVAVGAAEQDVGLDADRPQLAHAVLHRLGLQLVGGRDVGNEREVDEDRVVAAHVLAELAHRLQERQALDVAHRAPDLYDHHVGVLGRADRRLDLVGDGGITEPCARVSPRRSFAITEPRSLAGVMLSRETSRSG
jgi:hypothetical protein